MSGLGTLLHHPAIPVRAIELRRVGSGDEWQAIFEGDRWTKAFHTPPGSRFLVRDAILQPNVRHGLPIVDEDGPAVPSCSIPRRGCSEVRSGDAA